MKTRKISRKMAKATFAVLAIALVSTLVTATFLPNFGVVKTTMNIEQSVVAGDGTTWYNWDEPITRDLGNVVHCKDYCYKLLIKNRACCDAIVSFEDIPVEEGVDVSHWVFGGTQTIRLVQKEVVWGQSPWAELQDGMEAELTFNTCGTTFDWEITTEDDLTGYILIYYANYPDYWEEAPAIVLGGLSGTTDVPTMPYVDDENALRPISDEGESYDHQYGAKFWLVPCDAIDSGEINWGMADEFLFETDLGFYLDCDEWEPIPLRNVYPIFSTNILKAESIQCWITCYHVAFDIMPVYTTFETYIHAIEL